jgi:hypothetical protein
VAARQIERFIARLGLQQLEPLIQGLKHLPQRLTDQGVIVDNQDLQSSSLSTRTPPYELPGLGLILSS